jgi:serine protease
MQSLILHVLGCPTSWHSRRTVKLISLTCICFLTSMQVAFSQEHFYYYNGKKQPLQLNTEYVYVLTSGDVSDKQKLADRLGEGVAVSKFSRDNSTQTLKAFSSSSANLEYWSEVQLKAKMSVPEYLSYIKKSREKAGVELMAPYFKNELENKIGLSHYFMVKLRSEKDLRLLEKIAGETKTTIVGQNKFMPLWYTLRCTSESAYNALESANRFYESGLFAHAEPDLLIDDQPHAPNDPLFTDQWGLLNTSQYGGTAGIDINATQAWEVTKGSREVIVAVLDHGFEMNHPDLQGNTFGNGFDSESGTSPALVLGPHGTACAGIIGAIQDNNRGVSGIAPNVRLMSVSNSLAGSPLSRQKRADGINWAWQNGAHIISNSWGSSVPYAVIDNAITDALTLGRGGLGTLIIFSAGNSNNAVSYPANINPDIIAVGASDDCGLRIEPIGSGSCLAWNASQGSCFGPPLDVMAPGAMISTTDQQGGSGYHASDYTATFGGTSAACPMVAGVVALVLSVNPCLTHDEVEDIIEQTAQKVGGYGYAITGGRPNGTWHNEMGYGLVDAAAAVQMAQNMLPTASLFDIFSKDRPFDTGVEPNPDAGPMYITSDIWVRKNLDGGATHENPEYKLYSPNGVYVKVTNRGTTPSTCANLSLYFSKASTGLVWPTHWSDYFQVTTAGNILHGDKINTVLIPGLAPGASYTLEIPWFPPNPADFDNDVHHFCILSRIQSPADPMFDEQNLVGVGGNVRRNNNIVWKNVSIYDNDVDGSDAGVSVFVRGTERERSHVNLRFWDKGFKERILIRFFERGGKILMKADSKFMERIKSARLAGGIKIYDDNTILITDGEAQIAELLLYPKETFSLTLRFFVDLADNEATILDVVQQNAKTQAIEGGERFIVQRIKNGDDWSANVVVKDNNPMVYPIPSNGELFVKYHVGSDNSVVEISIHNIQDSKQKTTLYSGSRLKGDYQEKLNVASVKKGIYVVSIKVGDKTIHERMVIE